MKPVHLLESLNHLIGELQHKRIVFILETLDGQKELVIIRLIDGHGVLVRGRPRVDRLDLHFRLLLLAPLVLRNLLQKKFLRVVSHRRDQQVLLHFRNPREAQQVHRGKLFL